MDDDKLIVLGRLAGGVAHDFNNQLTSIIGYADLLLDELPDDASARQDLMAIRRAAERAHLVTTHLLAFNRPRAAEPAIVSLSAAVTSHLHLLKRVIGEDIRIVTAIDRASIDAEPDFVQADPAHLAQALFCLGADARDALPHGGTLTIDIRNVADSVRLSTEASMTEVRLPGRFASVIDDIVRLSGGHVSFEHTADGGALTIIRLPRVQRSAADVDVQSMPPRGIEHVLIVEDDMGVRDLLRQVLERHGYTVRLTERPSQALALAGSTHPPIDLAIVDVMLPEQRGDLLASALVGLRPGLRVLYISGHAAEEVTPTRADSASFFLRKPFSSNELLITVRQAIDSMPLREGQKGNHR